MTEIRLTNTKTRRKEDFVPIDPGDVRMYVCGPTVYDRAHLGNARPVVVFDVLYRLLRHVYGADHVTYVRNFTDVDDKINARALENVGPDGDVTAEIARITGETTQWFLDDMGALGALEPDKMPRATQYIPQMIAMIETLIERGHAYVVRDKSNDPPQEYVLFDREQRDSSHTLFDVDSFDAYGQLSGRSVQDMMAGARVEVAPYKRNPMDFVLWKPSSEDQPGWDSPWGRGRPGWHIECSAMAYELLGESFDIHGGGNDLMFPHHENEIAQSCCAHPEGDFARYWLHNEMLQVEGKKMSKSLGNFFTVRDLLDQGYPGEVIRFVFLSTHYRKPMDWTAEKAREAEATLRKWRSLVNSEPAGGKPHPAVLAAIADDLNTSKAISELHKLADDLNRKERTEVTEQQLSEFVASARLLGLLEDSANMGSWVFGSAVDQTSVTLLLEELEGTLSEARSAAKASKDFTQVDRLKEALREAGVEVRMSKDGVELKPAAGFDPAKLEGLA